MCAPELDHFSLLFFLPPPRLPLSVLCFHSAPPSSSSSTLRFLRLFLQSRALCLSLSRLSCCVSVTGGDARLRRRCFQKPAPAVAGSKRATPPPPPILPHPTLLPACTNKERCFRCSEEPATSNLKSVEWMWNSCFESTSMILLSNNTQI